MGVDLGDVAVADDEQRRVVERQGVGHQLLEGGAEIAAGALVLPAEVAALPDIGPAMPGAGARGAALEAVVVGIVGRLDAEHGAQVEEKWLRAGAFGERVVTPSGDELGGCHGGSHGAIFAEIAARCSCCSHPATMQGNPPVHQPPSPATVDLAQNAVTLSAI